MKYIINENRLEQMVFKFLDSKFEDLEQVKGIRYDFVFKFPGEKYGVLAWKKPRKLHIYYELINDISSFFPMKDSDIEKIIGSYIEDRYNLKVRTTVRESWSISD